MAFMFLPLKNMNAAKDFEKGDGVLGSGKKTFSKVFSRLSNLRKLFIRNRAQTP